jgi:hypothetical protein
VVPREWCVRAYTASHGGDVCLDLVDACTIIGTMPTESTERRR